jgi:hypothetical protein
MQVTKELLYLVPLCSVLPRSLEIIQPQKKRLLASYIQDSLIQVGISGSRRYLEIVGEMADNQC